VELVESVNERKSVVVSFYKKLVVFMMVLTLAIVMLGAWVRLTDAGLGCPDWPGCYGNLLPSQSKDKIAAAVAEQGGEHGPVSLGKAWREMIHRYFAKSLGLFAIIAVGIAWVKRRELHQSPWLATTLLGVIICQGLFGMWTVTMKLMPIIVTAHLMGGMLVFSMLVWLWQKQRGVMKYRDPEPAAALKTAAAVGLGLLTVQVFLGGWTSTNYAALACFDLPTCQSKWWPDMQWRDAFDFTRELGKTDSGASIGLAELTAMHFTHRMGAIVVFLFLGWLGSKALKTDGLKGVGIAILVGLTVQICLGLSNVYWSLPLPVAVMHNGGAAFLLGCLVVLNVRTARAKLAI
jgi:heme a synthase